MKRTMMKRTLFFALTCLLACGAAEIRVPSQWKSKGKAAAYRVSEAGFSADAERAAWAIRINGLEEMLKSGHFLISLYMNTDSDVNTGRTPGKDGCDFQMNIQVGPRTLTAIDWRKNTQRRIPLDKEDYFIESRGDILYIVLRGESLKDAVKFNDRMTLRLQMSTATVPRLVFDQRIDRTRTYGEMTPAFSFTPFRPKPAVQRQEALPVPRKGEIMVPSLWKSGSDLPEYRITEAGFSADADRAVWAIRINGLQKMLKMERFLISLYMNTDCDMATGRTPGKDGCDFQLNIQVGPRTLSAIDWRKGRFQRIPLYDDDYLIDSKGDILYILLRGEPLKDAVKFNDKMTLRLLVGAGAVPQQVFDRRIDLKRIYGMMLPALPFTRFGAERSALIKTPEAVLIPRNDGLKVWNTFGERFRDDEPMPPVVGKEPALRFSAARGEREAVHFAVTAPKPFQTLEIVPGDLKGPGNAVIPGSALAVRYVGFATTIREESYTDILYRAYKAQSSPHHFALIGVTVPRDAVPGIYRGTAQLIADGKKREPLPLELEIYPFTLPETRSFKTAYCLKPAFVRNHFPEATPAERAQEFEAQCRIAREFRFSPRLPHCLPELTWTRDEKLLIDWSRFDKVIDQYFNEYKFTVFQDSLFQIGSHGGPLYPRIRKLLGNDVKTSDPRFEKFFSQLVKQVHDHYKALGIFDRCVFFIWDEPYESVYPDIRRCCEIARKAAPDVKWAVAIDHAAPPLKEAVSVWATNFLTLYNLRSDPATRDQRVWCYNKIGMESFRDPASVPRLYYWLAKRYRVECYEYSEINGYQPRHQGKKPGAVYNTWVNYNWLYPDEKPGTPFASLRMVLTADGMDDYDYLRLFEERFGAEKLPAEVKAAFPELVAGGHINFPVRTNRGLQKIREILARELSR